MFLERFKQVNLKTINKSENVFKKTNSKRASFKHNRLKLIHLIRQWQNGTSSSYFEKENCQ